LKIALFLQKNMKTLAEYSTPLLDGLGRLKKG